MGKQKHILLINGSRSGSAGNTDELLDLAQELLSPHSVQRLDLAGQKDIANWKSAIEQSDVFIFGTGTYWDSWGSPLQYFLEEMTETEGTSLWLGKPAAVVVTMHSVGGKGILSSLQGVLNTFGLMIPPMCGLVCSTASQFALAASDSPLVEDLWRPSDLEIICHNLLEAVNGTTNWKSWPVDGEGFEGKWLIR